MAKTAIKHLKYGYRGIFKITMRRVTSRAFPSDNLVGEPATLARFIRAARTQSGLTLEYAALVIGVAKSTLQKIETNPATVSFAIVLEVARQLGVTLFAVPAEQREAVRRMIARLPDASSRDSKI